GAGTDHKATLVPQGTSATVYWKDATGAELNDLAKKIKDEVNPACANLAEGVGSTAAGVEDCIDTVYATHSLPGLTVPLVPTDWHYDSLSIDSKTKVVTREGATGELVVISKRPWAFGRVLPYAQGNADQI